MNLKKWKPFNQDPFSDFFESDHPLMGLSLFPGFNQLRAYFDEGLSPAIDVKEDEKNIIVKADLPGIDKKHISVALKDNVLTIRGERKYEKEGKEKGYQHIERSYGVFSAQP